MAINKAVMSAIKAISYAGIDIRKSYKAERQMQLLGAKLKASPRPPKYETWDRKVYCDGHIVPVRLYPPSGGRGDVRPTLIFFHGGGWVLGDIDTYNSVCIDMAKETNRWVVSVDYRLAPENPFPAGLQDCYAITKELYQKGILGKSKDVTIIGDSAGGNLAAALSLMARDKGEFTVSRQILIYPAVNNDYSENCEFESVVENGKDYLLTAKRISEYMELYRSGEKDMDSPYLAPLNAKNFENQPKTLIITAEFDPLCDEGEYYGEKLREAGNSVKIHRLPDAIHGCFTLPHRFSVVEEIYREINDFLGEE